jgi:two-component system response regulator AtoC
MVLEVPPLRDRKDEILPLAELFAGGACKASRRRSIRLAPAAAQLLQAHRWPGNVRELRNVIERAVLLAMGDEITAEDLPDRLRGPARSGAPASLAGGAGRPAVVRDLRRELEDVEKRLITEALEANAWNQSRTAEALNMPRRTLVFKIRRHGIHRPGPDGLE